MEGGEEENLEGLGQVSEKVGDEKKEKDTAGKLNQEDWQSMIAAETMSCMRKMLQKS